MTARYILMLSLLILPGCATTLSGTVKDQTGQPIAQGKINIHRLSPSVESENNWLVDIEDGAYQSADLSDQGEYLIEVLAPGYRLTSQKITVTESQTLNLSLEKLPGKTARGVSANPHVELGRGEGNATIAPPQF